MFTQNRRNFLKHILISIVGIIFFNPMALSRQLNRSFGKGRSGYFSRIMHTLYQWHCENYFDFQKSFSTEEKEYIDACTQQMTLWRYDIHQAPWLRSATYSHKIYKGSINSSRFACGHLGNKKNILDIVHKVMKKRNLELSENELKYFYGLGWDFKEEHFKVYTYHPDAEGLSTTQMMLKKKLNKFSSKKNFIGLTLYKKNKKIEQKIYGSLADHKKDILIPPFLRGRANIHQVNLMVGEQSGVESYYDLKNFNLSMPSSEGEKIENKYKTAFGLTAGTIRYRALDDYTIYYL